MAFVAVPVLVAVAPLCGLVPWVGPFLLLLAAPQILGAVPALALAAVDARGVHPRLLVDGFRRYERWLGLFGVAYLVSVALALPAVLAFWLRLRFLRGVAGDGLFFASLVVSGAAWLLLFQRYLFAPFVAVDQPRQRSLQDVLDHADGMLRGRRVEVLLVAGFLLLLTASGALAAGVGLIVTGPVGVFALAALYRSQATGSLPGDRSSEPGIGDRAVAIAQRQKDVSRVYDVSRPDAISQVAP